MTKFKSQGLHIIRIECLNANGSPPSLIGILHNKQAKLRKVMQHSAHTYQACRPWGCQGCHTDQLILSQSGVADCAHHITIGTPDFQTFLRPCVWNT